MYQNATNGSSSATAATRTVDCNSDAMPPFAAARIGGILTRFILTQNTTFAKLVLLAFKIDSATYFAPKFGHGVVDCPAVGGIVRDDKPFPSINAD